VKLPWRRSAPGDTAASGDQAQPPLTPIPYAESGRVPRSARKPTEAELVERPPTVLRRLGTWLAETRRRVLPLPDEVIDQYLGHGERMIHNDHPSFRNFVVENTLLFAGLLLAAILFLGISFNGSLAAAGLLLLILSIVLLILVLRRLGDRYTSYVVTDTRIMRISGIISRRAHSIPWVRVTDLTIEQSLAGRLFGYATLHIESANEDSGLRNLDGVSDPLQFNQYVVDMVVAKQGATEPVWQQRGEPAPIASEKGFRRIRASSRRRRTDGDLADVPGGDDPTASTAGGGRAPGRRRVSVGGGPAAGTAADTAAGRSPQVTYGSGRDEGGDVPDEDELEIDPEELARDLRSQQGPDLPWRKSPPGRG
jgi:membrane protein YdbS with pleckstrin-like domain